MTKTITMIAGLLLMISCANNRNGENCSAKHPGSTTADTTFTQFIPKDSANKMLGSYLNSIDYSHNDTALQSITIDVHKLRQYIDSTPGSNNITGVKLMFAHTLDYINTGHGNQYAGYNSGKLTLIISAFNAAGDYIYLNNQVVDFGMPCPTNCPPGNAASPLLQ